LITPTCTITGSFFNNKPHGDTVKITKYNYKFEGECKSGLKSGKGV
jgi:hypothetical protein